MGKKTDFFRVAVSGSTIDGRTIEPQDINDMAATYNRATYGARIWLEHIRGITADGPFNALGDVIELEARDVVINDNTVRGLYAKIDATDELIAINEKSQKIYSSIEIAPNFAQTGKAYLYGLAVTDSPASLGTEALKFCIHRKQDQANIFTEGLETSFSIQTIETAKPSESESLFKKIVELFQQKPPVIEPTKNPEPAETDSNFMTAILELSKKVDQLSTELATKDSKINELSKQLNELEKPVEDKEFTHAKVTGDLSPLETDC